MENTQTIEEIKIQYIRWVGCDFEENGKEKNKIMSDSNLLEDICKEIGRALPKTKILGNDLKGTFDIILKPI